jgi:anti-sigma factor RsiW
MSRGPEPFDGADMPDLPCREFVALVTDYLEDALEPGQVVIVEAHLVSCTGCTSVLAQWREVIALTGRLRPRDVVDVDPTVRTALLDTFRRLHPA